MQLSSKCYYALRAVYALAAHTETTPLKIADIAERQRIPMKFLEAILNHLKGGGFVRSWRGAEGGYRLARPADQISIGEVLRFIDGPIAPVDCVSQSRPTDCIFLGDCTFYEFWEQLRQSISDVVDRTTFADLVKRNRNRVRAVEAAYVGDWMI